MVVALEALADLQKEINNGPTNLKNQFWAVDSNGKKPQPPIHPEPACRDVICHELKWRVKDKNIRVLPEVRHGDQKNSDIGLLVQPEILLPIIDAKVLVFIWFYG